MKNQAFAVVTEQYNFGDPSWVGILGLGFDNKVVNQMPTFMDNLHTAGRIETKVFGIYLNANATDNFAGMLSFGGSDLRFHCGFLVAVPLSRKSRGDWQITADDIYLKRQYKFKTKLPAEYEIVLDTGALLVCTFQ